MLDLLYLLKCKCCFDMQMVFGSFCWLKYHTTDKHAWIHITHPDIYMYTTESKSTCPVLSRKCWALSREIANDIFVSLWHHRVPVPIRTRTSGTLRVVTNCRRVYWYLKYMCIYMYQMLNIFFVAYILQYIKCLPF